MARRRIRRPSYVGYAAVRFRFRVAFGTTSTVSLAPSAVAQRHRVCSSMFFCAARLELGDVTLTHAESLGELCLRHGALAAKRGKFLLDHRLDEVFIHFPLEIGVGVDLMIDPLHEIALSSHLPHLI